MKKTLQYILTKGIITLGIISAISTPSPAQEAVQDSEAAFKRHSIFLEMGGNGGFYSLNYEYSLMQRISVRLGTELFPSAWTEDVETVAGFPVMVNYQVYRLKNHRLLVGLGALVVTNGVTSMTASVAYELRVADEAMLRLGFTPHYVDGSYAPWAGVGVGFIF